MKEKKDIEKKFLALLNRHMNKQKEKDGAVINVDFIERRRNK